MPTRRGMGHALERVQDPESLASRFRKCMVVRRPDRGAYQSGNARQITHPPESFKNVTIGMWEPRFSGN